MELCPLFWGHKPGLLCSWWSALCSLVNFMSIACQKLQFPLDNAGLEMMALLSQTDTVNFTKGLQVKDAQGPLLPKCLLLKNVTKRIFGTDSWLSIMYP